MLVIMEDIGNHLNDVKACKMVHEDNVKVVSYLS